MSTVTSMGFREHLLGDAQRRACTAEQTRSKTLMLIFSNDPDEKVRKALAKNPSLASSVIQKLAAKDSGAVLSHLLHFQRERLNGQAVETIARRADAEEVQYLCALYRDNPQVPTILLKRFLSKEIPARCSISIVRHPLFDTNHLAHLLASLINDPQWGDENAKINAIFALKAKEWPLESYLNVPLSFIDLTDLLYKLRKNDPLTLTLLEAVYPLAATEKEGLTLKDVFNIAEDLKRHPSRDIIETLLRDGWEGSLNELLTTAAALDADQSHG